MYIFNETQERNIVSIYGVKLLVAPKFATVEIVFEIQCGSGITENTFGKSLPS